ncbi:MAG TPA: ATP-binding protein, partial [Chitinophagaceae bacterium]|nr:ATP-binding protein [Chitinophagaceae bacterium]
AYTSLALNYNKNNKDDSAYKYMAMAKNMNDSLNNIQITNLGKFHSMGFEEKLRLKELETETIVNKSRNRVILLLVIIIVFFVIAFILYRNNKVKQKTNKILQTTLSNLKSTQSQLIQSEKMASLGELTAGIAHEIQNPLNFVNNFSEVSKELLDEMKAALSNGNDNDAKAIADDVIQNLEKIQHHGKRADAIVKGMLQHSRTSTGQKEPTDINAIANEYFKLSYHGMRAKDNSFNATTYTDFDESLSADEAGVGNIDIIPQEIGRVLLNLFNNAFYAINEKKKISGDTYTPMIFVSTEKINDKVEIKVKDNGIGIPQKVLDKIFQPFFTTKPTGQGTGLGLSLSYDVIKAHGGEIKVQTKENEGTEFTVILPIN